MVPVTFSEDSMSKGVVILQAPASFHEVLTALKAAESGRLGMWCPISGRQ